jgi:hypothetical protein
VRSQLGRKIAKVTAYSTVGLVLFLALLLTGIVSFLQGERLASVVNYVLPAQRGQMRFGSIHIRPRILYDLLADRATPVVVGNLRITDPEGTVVLDVPQLEVSVRLQPLISGAGIILSDLKVGPNSIWRFAKMKTQKGIGFLSAFDSKTPAPPPPPEKKKEAGSIFQIVNAELNGFRAIFDFPGAWGLDLRDIHAPASVLVDGKGFVGWDVTNLEARQGGYLRIISEELPFDHVIVNRVSTDRAWSDDIFLDLKAARTGRTTLMGKGFFTGIYGADSVSGIKIHAEFLAAADALSAVAKPHQLTGLRLSGESAKVAADLFGPYDTLKINASISELDVAYETYQAKSLSLVAGLVFSPTEPTLTVNVDPLSFNSPEGGSFRTQLTLKGDELAAKFNLEKFKTQGYVPLNLKSLATGTLHGQMGIKANLGERKSLRLEKLDLTFDRALAKFPGTIRLTGEAQANQDEVSTKNLQIQIPGASTKIRGAVNLAKRTIAAGLHLSTSSLPSLLTRLGTPPLIKEAEAHITVDGSLDNPNANGNIDLRGIGGPQSGIPWIEQLSTQFRLADGQFNLDSLLAKVASGIIEGKGNATLFQESIQRPLAAPTLNFRIAGKHLSLSELLVNGIISGKVGFQIVAAGTSKNPRVHFTLPAGAVVEVLGHAWQLEGIDIEATKEWLLVRLCQIKNPQGGSISIEGRLGIQNKTWPTEWTIQIKALPLAAILGMAKVNLPLAGMLTLNVSITGTARAPLISGTLAISQVEYGGMHLGDAKLTFSPSHQNGIHVEGRLFERLDVVATGMWEPKGLALVSRLSFSEVHIEELLPTLSEAGLTTVISGEANVVLDPGQPVRADLLLTQIEAAIERVVDQATGPSKKERLWIRNANPLQIHASNGRIALTPFRLLTQGGEFTMSGTLHESNQPSSPIPSITAAFDGRIDLELLQPFVRAQVSELGGSLALSLRVSGTVAAPIPQGTISIVRPLHGVPAGMELPIQVPSGTIQITTQALNLANLSFDLGGSRLHVAGNVGLDPGFAPTTLAFEVRGNLNAHVLESLAQQAVTDVSGDAILEAHIQGTVTDPQINASIDLRQIQMRLRGLQGQVKLEEGRIDLNTHELVLSKLRLRVADEGLLTIGEKRPGRLRIRKLFPQFEWQDVDFPIQGSKLAYRSSTIEIDDLSFAFNISGEPETGLKVEGDVQLVSGRYLQDFNIRDLVLSPGRINESDSTPFWSDIALLENLALDLRVRTVGNSFIVQNNLAPEINILIELGVGGTLAQPTLSGEIRPTDGRFHILGLRGDFELVPNVNHVTFVPTKSIAAGDTPELNLQAQNIIVDASNIEHTVIMRITGPIGQATIDMTTTDGLDRNQTMLLLLSGRTTEDLSGNGGPIFGMNSATTLSFVGQASRDAVSNLIEPYIDDTLQLLTGRKLNLRPTIGADGFEVRIRANTSREFDLELSYLRGFQGQTRYGGKGQLWLRDYVTTRVIGDRYTYSLQQGIPRQESNYRLELTFEYPIRSFSP